MKTQQQIQKNKIIPEFISGSSTHAVIKQQALKTLKKFQGLSNFTATNGFTLIELLVVVLIIGILAAVAVPQYQVAVLKSQFTRAKIMTKAIANAQEVYYLTNGKYSTSFDDLDIDTPAYTKETISVVNGINRPQRFFSWGHCRLWQNNTVSCNLNDTVRYMIYYNHHSENPGLTECTAYSTNLSSRENKLCKSDTKSEVPSTVGGSYMIWSYQ